MDIQNLVKQELHKIHRSRNRIGYFPSLASLLLSVYFQREKLPFDFRWWVVVGLMTAGTGIRIVVNEVLFNEWENEVKWVRLVNYFAFFCISSSWGLHFADIYFHYGGLSTNVTYTLLVMVAFMTGASTYNVGDKIAYYIFVLVMSSIASLTYMMDPNEGHYYIVFNFAIYLAFSISNYRVNTRQLCETIEAKITSTHEKENLRNIINTVPGYVVLIDRNLNYHMANQSALNNVPDLIGRKVGTIDPDHGWEQFIIDFMHSDKTADISEQSSDYSGKVEHFLMNIQKMDDGGAIVATIITTDMVEAQNKLREQEAKAYFTSKLASLGEMAAGIAHEVNNPLAIIQGSANMLDKIIDKEPKDVELIKALSGKIIETSERISKTIRSLKALSRNGVNDPKTKVSLPLVINQCLDISLQKLKALDIQLIYEAPSEDVIVFGREVELSQVLINLMMNSIDAIRNLEEKWIKIEILKNSAFVDIKVSDSGKGIPPEIRDKIMNPFFTTKDVNQGTGLGLSISKNIISSHGGELSLLPNEAHTTFRIRLPLEKNS